MRHVQRKTEQVRDRLQERVRLLTEAAQRQNPPSIQISASVRSRAAPAPAPARASDSVWGKLAGSRGGGGGAGAAAAQEFYHKVVKGYEARTAGLLEENGHLRTALAVLSRELADTVNASLGEAPLAAALGGATAEMPFDLVAAEVQEGLRDSLAALRARLAEAPCQGRAPSPPSPPPTAHGREADARPARLEAGLAEARRLMAADAKEPQRAADARGAWLQRGAVSVASPAAPRGLACPAPSSGPSPPGEGDRAGDRAGDLAGDRAGDRAGGRAGGRAAPARVSSDGAQTPPCPGASALGGTACVSGAAEALAIGVLSPI